MFIVFEGVDGAGKSTQIKKLASYLKQKNYDIVLTREPGGTDDGEIIRDVLLHKKLSVVDQYLLLLAARATHIEEVIEPALSKNKIVLCDRYADSTAVYQNEINRISFPELFRAGELLAEQAIPNLTILLHVSPNVSIRRLKNRFSDKSDVFENSITLDLIKKRQDKYLEIANNNKNRYVIVNADQKSNATHNEIVNAVEDLLNGHQYT